VGGDVHLHAGNGKGRHRIRASFQAVRPMAGGPLPRRSRESWRSYTPRRPWTAPVLAWVRPAQRLSRALVTKVLTGARPASGLRAGSLELYRAIYGYGVGGSGREAGGLKREQRPRGGPGPLSRARQGLAPEGGTIASAVIARHVRGVLIDSPAACCQGGRTPEVLRSLLVPIHFFSYVAGILRAPAAPPESRIRKTRTP